MLFWLIIGAMTLLAGGALAWPMLRVRDLGDPAQHQYDHLRRLDEFTDDLTHGDIAADSAEAVRNELERAVHDGVTRQAGTRRTTRGSPVQALLMALIPALAIMIYLELGRPEIGGFLASRPARALQEPAVAVEFLLEQLKARVAEKPEDREAWRIFAHTLHQLGRYPEAEAAAKRLLALTPDDTATLTLLIDARAMQAGGTLDDDTATLIGRLLELEPDNVNGLVLQGMVHMQRHDLSAAAKLWRRALPLLPPDAPLRAELAPLLTAVDKPPVATDSVRLAVSVVLEPTLVTAGTTAQTPVYILARAVGGPAAPLAVVRQTVGDLPLEVELNDTMGMVPGLSLADFTEIEVVARIAIGGEPRAQSGDLEGRSAVVTTRPGVQQVVVRIGEILP